MGSRGSAVSITAITSIIVTTIALALRFYVRCFLLRRLQADDALILFCWIVFVAYLYCVLQQVKLGLGQHIEDILIHPENIEKLLLYYFISTNFLYAALGAVKIATAMFFLSLSPPHGLRIAALSMIVFTIVVTLAAELFLVFGCLPVSYTWTRFNGFLMGQPTKGHCVRNKKALPINQLLNAMDIIADFILAALPTIMVWNMQLSRARKCEVSFLLGLGAFSAISPLIRAFYLIPFTHNIDVSYWTAPIVILAITEIAFAITVVCVAQLRPLMRQIMSASWTMVQEPAGIEMPARHAFEGDRRLKPVHLRELSHLQITLHCHDSVHERMGVEGHVMV